MPCGDRGVERLAGQHVADRLLEGRGDVGDRHRLAGALARLDPARDRGLEAGEREVEPVPLQVLARGQPAREVDVHAVPARAARSMCGPPGNGSPSSRATLSKASPAASSMVAPSGVDAAGHVLDPQQAGVAAADQHRQARLGQRPVLELVDGDMGGEVVDAVDRLAEPDRQRLRRGDADQQRTGQAGPLVTAIASTSSSRMPAVSQARSIVGHHRLEVGAAGDLGHDAAEARVLVDAAGDGVGEQGVAADDADAGLVAGGLDAEDQGLVHGAIMPRLGDSAEWGRARDTGAELLATYEDPFVRHQTDPAAVCGPACAGRRRSSRAAPPAGRRRHGVHGLGPPLGPCAELTGAVAEVTERAGAVSVAATRSRRAGAWQPRTRQPVALDD